MSAFAGKQPLVKVCFILKADGLVEVRKTKRYLLKGLCVNNASLIFCSHSNRQDRFKNGTPDKIFLYL